MFGKDSKAKSEDRGSLAGDLYKNATKMYFPSEREKN